MDFSFCFTYILHSANPNPTPKTLTGVFYQMVHCKRVSETIVTQQQFVLDMQDLNFKNHNPFMVTSEDFNHTPLCCTLNFTKGCQLIFVPFILYFVIHNNTLYYNNNIFP